MNEFVIIVGFMLAAYAIIANDSIQTLGTFLYSNRNRPWWVLCLFTSTILVGVILIGFFANGGTLESGGDPSYGRLSRFPVNDLLDWRYIVPPIALLILTQFGFPVSTSFLILITFSPGALGPMLQKSAMGYLVAFVLAFILYLVTKRLTDHFLRTQDEKISPYWVVAQWVSTGFLWSMWLMQDVANIFVYFPGTRDTIPFTWVLLGVIWMVLIQIFIYRIGGGKIQHVVKSKTSTGDIRAATIVDALYGLILWYFKIKSDWPMSTTWVFIGLLAGRELAIASLSHNRLIKDVVKLVLKDGGKLLTGLAVSVALAFFLRPDIYFGKDEEAPSENQSVETEEPAEEMDAVDAPSGNGEGSMPEAGPESVP